LPPPPSAPHAAPGAGGRALSDVVDAAERSAIEGALRESEGSRERAAELLNISPTTLWRKMTRLGVTFESRGRPRAAYAACGDTATVQRDSTLGRCGLPASPRRTFRGRPTAPVRGIPTSSSVRSPLIVSRCKGETRPRPAAARSPGNIGKDSVASRALDG